MLKFGTHCLTGVAYGLEPAIFATGKQRLTIRPPGQFAQPNEWFKQKISYLIYYDLYQNLSRISVVNQSFTALDTLNIESSTVPEIEVKMSGHQLLKLKWYQKISTIYLCFHLSVRKFENR
jgi:hypothetical protein